MPLLSELIREIELSPDFLSQAEVDALLKGVSEDDDAITIDGAIALLINRRDRLNRQVVEFHARVEEIHDAINLLKRIKPNGTP